MNSDVSPQAVLSIDDDLLLPCRELAQAHNVWMANQRCLFHACTVWEHV